MSQKRPAEQLTENNGVVAPEQDTKPLKQHTARPAKMKAKKPVRAKLAIVGICLIFATAIGLFGYQFYLNVGTGIVAEKAQAQVMGSYEKEKAVIADTKKLASTPDSKDGGVVYSMENLPTWGYVASTPLDGEIIPYGTVEIPRINSKWENGLKPLTQGYEVGSNPEERRSNLAKTQLLVDKLAIVHYSQTAQPGEIGNFSITGHRSGYGNVFEDIHLLEIGDEARIDTLDKGTFVYKVVQNPVGFSPKPTDPNAELYNDSNPFGTEKNTTRRLMTVASCLPWDSSGRVAVVFELTDYIPAE